jgi:hypothetical protein
MTTKEVTITAYDIYEAAFDKACEEYYENLSLGALCKYVEEYAEGCFSVKFDLETGGGLVFAIAAQQKAKGIDVSDFESDLKQVEYKTSNENAVLMKELQKKYN